MNTDLACGFFEFAEDNLKVAKFLERSEYYVESLYQLAQVFKKIIKSYYILVKTRIEHNLQEKIYHDIIGFSHEIEDTSLNLLIEIANIEKQKCFQKANSPEGASNPRYTDRYEALIHQTTLHVCRDLVYDWSPHIILRIFIYPLSRHYYLSKAICCGNMVVIFITL